MKFFRKNLLGLLTHNENFRIISANKISATQYTNIYSAGEDRFTCPEGTNSDMCAQRTCQCDSQLVEDIFAQIEEWVRIFDCLLEKVPRRTIGHVEV